MFGLKGRQDAFRLLLPKEFLMPEIEEKYSEILRSKNSFYDTPIDFLNETIQKVQVLGFNDATVPQQQSSRGNKPVLDPKRQNQNEFMFPSNDYNYRSEVSPIALIDKTLNITFRHTLGYLNYFLLFENFFYQYTRDRNYKELDYRFSVDIYNEKGSIYSRILIDSPFVHSMDMLDFDFTQPIAQSQTFQVAFKYSNFDFQFINVVDEDKYYVDKDVVYVKDNNFLQ